MAHVLQSYNIILLDLTLTVNYHKLCKLIQIFFCRITRSSAPTSTMANDNNNPRTCDTQTDEGNESPRQGRRNALADIFEGLTPTTVTDLKQYCLRSLSQEDAKQFIDRLDVIQSERFHNRRNALWDLLDFLDTDSIQNLRNIMSQNRCNLSRHSESSSEDSRQEIH